MSKSRRKADHKWIKAVRLPVDSRWQEQSFDDVPDQDSPDTQDTQDTHNLPQ